MPEPLVVLLGVLSLDDPPRPPCEGASRSQAQVGTDVGLLAGIAAL